MTVSGTGGEELRATLAADVARLCSSLDRDVRSAARNARIGLDRAERRVQLAELRAALPERRAAAVRSFSPGTLGNFEVFQLLHDEDARVRRAVLMIADASSAHRALRLDGDAAVRTAAIGRCGSTAADFRALFNAQSDPDGDVRACAAQRFAETTFPVEVAGAHRLAQEHTPAAPAHARHRLSRLALRKPD